MGRCRKKIGGRTYKNFSDHDLQRAVALIKNGVLTERQAAEQFGIPKSTINRKRNKKNLKPVGRPCVLSTIEESMLLDGLVTAGKWGFPLTSKDIGFIVKNYLDTEGRKEQRFKDNLPGQDWLKLFLHRHNDVLTVKLCENIKRARVAVSCDTINLFFEELTKTIEGVDPELIINYDETNMTDDPGKKKVVVRRGTKHAECIKDTSKSSTSVMFCGTASGVILPLYVVYKAEHLYNTWTYNGPPGTRYNRSRSGWFDMTLFEDWFFSIVMPYFRKFPDKKKVMIGDNLASHVSTKVIESCKTNNISFVLLPPNSTHLTQPLDVAFFRPLKMKWKKQLDIWKDKNTGVLQKSQFPNILNKTMKELGPNASKNIIAGFEACGIVPLNPENVLKRIPRENSFSDDSWLNSFESHLAERRLNVISTNPRKKRVTVPAGKSISELNTEIVDTNSISNDIEDLEVVFSEEPVIDSINSEPENNPIIIVIPTTDQLPGPSGNNNQDDDDEDEVFDTKNLRVNDYVLVKCLYNKNSKKAKFKTFPCLIKHISKGINGIKFICSFLRQYKGRSETYVFPNVEDVMEVSEENILKRLMVIKEHRNTFTFNM